MDSAKLGACQSWVPRTRQRPRGIARWRIIIFRFCAPFAHLVGARGAILSVNYWAFKFIFRSSETSHPSASVVDTVSGWSRIRHVLICPWPWPWRFRSSVVSQCVKIHMPEIDRSPQLWVSKTWDICDHVHWLLNPKLMSETRVSNIVFWIVHTRELSLTQYRWLLTGRKHGPGMNHVTRRDSR